MMSGEKNPIQSDRYTSIFFAICRSDYYKALGFGLGTPIGIVLSMIQIFSKSASEAICVFILTFAHSRLYVVLFIPEDDTVYG